MHVGKHTRQGELIVGAKSLRERHIDALEKVGAMEWKEDFVDFTELTYPGLSYGRPAFPGYLRKETSKTVGVKF